MIHNEELLEGWDTLATRIALTVADSNLFTRRYAGRLVFPHASNGTPSEFEHTAGSIFVPLESELVCEARNKLNYNSGFDKKTIGDIETVLYGDKPGVAMAIGEEKFMKGTKSIRIVLANNVQQIPNTIYLPQSARNIQAIEDPTNVTSLWVTRNNYVSGTHEKVSHLLAELATAACAGIPDDLNSKFTLIIQHGPR